MNGFILVNKYFHLATRTGAIFIAIWILMKGIEYDDLALKLAGLIFLIFDTITAYLNLKLVLKE